MRLSIVITVLDSHEMFRRQLLYWKRLDLPKGIEFVIIDDGSVPELSANGEVRNLRIHQTHDSRPWTCSLARNLGVNLSEAPYVLLTDIDHILPLDTVLECASFEGDKKMFRREFGVLDEDGNFSQDLKTLLEYGLEESRVRTKGISAPVHNDSFVIKRDLFWLAGGYRSTDIGTYPPMGETHFRADYRELVKQGRAQPAVVGPMIYAVPTGYFCGDPNYNPKGLFHNLPRKRLK